MKVSSSRIAYILFLAVAVLMCPSPSNAQSSKNPTASTSSVPATAWITDSLVKIKSDGNAGTTQTIQLFAARNEFESFQLHLKAGDDPVTMNVTITDFINTGNSSSVISSAGNVTIHREVYQNISVKSDENGTLGNTPDALIPSKDAYVGEARNAFPFLVTANSVQSAWIDVHVPTNAAPGTYTAVATVTNSGIQIGQFTVSLRVWNFVLPSTATLKSAFGLTWSGMCIQAYGGYSGCGAYPGSGNDPDRAIELIHHNEAMFMLDHRISLSAVPYYGPPTGTWDHFDATYGDLLNGTAPTQLAGAKLTALQYTRSNPFVASEIQDWVSHFSGAGWLSALFHYTCDEPPSGCTWSDAQSDAATVKNASAAMKTLITTNFDLASQHGLLNVLNIMTPVVTDMDPQGGSNQRQTYDSWLSGGADRHVWWYQSCTSHGCGIVGSSQYTWPSYMIDASPVRNRVFQWLAFINRIEGELYFMTDYCWFYTDCASTDPWSSVYAFSGNGDGTLMYPGTPAKIGGSTPVPVASIRLKHLRDGMEDFEYLNLLSQAGDDDFARTAAASFITNAYTFNNDPTALASARQVLGQRLHTMSLPPCQRSSACTHDFNGDGDSDILWRNEDGTTAMWLMSGSGITSNGVIGAIPTSWSIVGQRDFNGDGKHDILWRNTTGDVAMWLMNGSAIASNIVIGNIPISWSIVGTADFDGDGYGDILWRENSTGNIAVWLMNGSGLKSNNFIGTIPTSWIIAGTGDFDGDGKSDILWRETATGNVAMWLMNGASLQSNIFVGNIPISWTISGTGDFNGDSKSDILWRETATGNTAVWLMNGSGIQTNILIGNIPTSWSISQTGDYDGDGKSDILWREAATGNIAMWLMNGGTLQSNVYIGNIPVNWTIQSANAN